MRFCCPLWHHKFSVWHVDLRPSVGEESSKVWKALKLIEFLGVTQLTLVIKSHLKSSGLSVWHFYPNVKPTAVSFFHIPNGCFNLSSDANSQLVAEDLMFAEALLHLLTHAARVLCFWTAWRPVFLQVIIHCPVCGSRANPTRFFFVPLAWAGKSQLNANIWRKTIRSEGVGDVEQKNQTQDGLVGRGFTRGMFSVTGELGSSVEKIKRGSLVFRTRGVARGRCGREQSARWPVRFQQWWKRGCLWQQLQGGGEKDDGNKKKRLSV